MGAYTALFASRVRDVMQPPPPTVPDHLGCGALVELLAERKASAALVTDGTRRVRAIVTDADLVRRAAFRMPHDTAVSAVMTMPVRTAHEDEYLYQAVARMRTEGLRRLPVVDPDGAPVGLVTLEDALAALAAPLVRQIERLQHEDSTAGLRAMKSAQTGMAAELLAGHVPGPEIQRLLTDVNNEVHRCVAEAELREMALAGWGEPPVGFTLIVMGSGGRGENHLAPDQDNGLILDAYDDARHGAIDPFFVEFASRLTRTLDAVGFPLCRGNVMATNPVWRKTLPQWRAQVDLWLRKRDTVTIRLCDIFFDFQPAYGSTVRAAELRDHVARRVKGNHAFLAEMYRTTADHGVAVDRFGRLIAETTGAHRREINLKYAALVPLVETVRLLTLREGLTRTATLDRLEDLARVGLLGSDELDYLAGAFRLVATLLLRRQLDDLHGGQTVGTHVALDEMTQRERDMLGDGLTAIRRFRDRVKTMFTATL